MAGGPTDRLPLHTIILPVLGLAAWLVVGKTGLGPVALLLALAVTVIEVGLIISIMLSGEPNLTLLRDSVHAVVMLVLHGLAGLCILVGAFRERESEFQVEGAKAFLAVLLPMATLVMVVPNYLVSAPGPYYSPLQLAFVSAVCLGLYIAFLFIQTGWHRAYFLPIGEEGGAGHARPSGRVAFVSFSLL